MQLVFFFVGLALAVDNVAFKFPKFVLDDSVILNVYYVSQPSI